MQTIIDSHIHLDQYSDEQISSMIKKQKQAEFSHLVSVSTDLASCKRNLKLAEQYKSVVPAFGFHPEQRLPNDQVLTDLIQWIEHHQEAMVAIGEIGLPYYMKMEENELDITRYSEVLEQFLVLAKRLDKPVSLHAIYEDAKSVCDLLEKHSIRAAHFHWFKGDSVTVERIIQNGYLISVTPDVTYEHEIQQLVKQVPLANMMVETDGPWPFEGEFTDDKTHPKMIHSSVQTIAMLKKEPLSTVYEQLWNNTNEFFRLSGKNGL